MFKETSRESVKDGVTLLMFVVISSLMCEALESSGEDVEEIEFMSDSSWKPVKRDRSNKESALHPPNHSKIRSQISFSRHL